MSTTTACGRLWLVTITSPWRATSRRIFPQPALTADEGCTGVPSPASWMTVSSAALGMTDYLCLGLVAVDVLPTFALYGLNVQFARTCPFCARSVSRGATGAG